MSEKRLTPAERRMMIHGPAKAREAFTEGASRREQRRLEQEAEREAEREQKFAGKLATRKDVMAIIELFNQRKILPLAHNLDQLASFVYAPWWKRLYIRWLGRGQRLVAWLARKGIRIVRTKADKDTQQEEE